MRGVWAHDAHRGHGNIRGKKPCIVQRVSEKHLEVRRRKGVLGRGGYDDLTLAATFAVALPRADVRYDKAKVREGIVGRHESLGQHVDVERRRDPRTGGVDGRSKAGTKPGRR